MREDFVWERAGRSGLEHMQWAPVAPGKAQSVLVANLDGIALNFRHVWIWDHHWSIKRVFLFVLVRGGQSSIDISITPDGRWTVDGHHRPDLENCLGADVPDSPFPKMMLIRRLNLDEGEAVEVPVATLDVQSLQVTAVRQKWQRLAQRTDGQAEYHCTVDRMSDKYFIDDEGALVLAFGKWRLRRKCQLD